MPSLLILVRPDVMGSIRGIYVCFIKQLNSPLSRMYVQMCIRVKWVAVSVHSENWNVVLNVFLIHS